MYFAGRQSRKKDRREPAPSHLLLEYIVNSHRPKRGIANVEKGETATQIEKNVTIIGLRD